MPDQKHLVALQRFGLGAAPGERISLGDDPRGAVLRQISAPPPPASSGPKLPPDSATAIVMLMEQRQVAADARAALRHSMAGQAVAPGGNWPEGPTPTRPPRVVGGPEPIAIMSEELSLALDRATRTTTPLIERLSLFWMDHFTASAAVGAVRFLVGAEEREAIRPNLLGRFEAMAKAAILHPAMLFFLDNRNSTGPRSPMGDRTRGHLGLNENLAREALELHTVGVDGGYTQDDVIALAKVLTGWSVDLSSEPRGPRVRFFPERHEPGPKTVLGRTYQQDGPDQALAVIDDLARHPSTARHVTRRMVRHFVGHGLPGLESRMAEVFRRSDGDLGVVTRALVQDDEAWGAPRKVRAPVELLMATARLLGGLPPQPPPMRALSAMGQPFWAAPSPKGWPVDDDAWAAPDAIKTRLDWAAELASRLPSRTDARTLMDAAFGPLASAETRRAVERAADGRQAVTLLLLSPEFQRR